MFAFSVDGNNEKLPAWGAWILVVLFGFSALVFLKRFLLGAKPGDDPLD